MYICVNNILYIVVTDTCLLQPVSGDLNLHTDINMYMYMYAYIVGEWSESTYIVV